MFRRGRGSSISTALVDPRSDRLDSFDAGVEPWSALTTSYFRGRKWLEMRPAAADCYEFRAGRDTVGFASALVVPCQHPSEGDPETALYLKIFMLGVNLPMRGRVLASGRTAFAELMEEVERLALEVPECVGLYLWVNVLNERAIGAYEKVGFTRDVQISKFGKDLWVMRKRIR